MKKMRKTLAFVLVFAVVVSLFATFSIVGQAYTTPGNVDSSTIQTRINTICSSMGNGYFTTTNNPCLSTREGGHWCSKCNVENVINSSWFKSNFGLSGISTAQFPQTYYRYQNPGVAGYSCFGFAVFAAWYIFRTNDTDKVSTYKVGTYINNYSNAIANVKPGDILRYGSPKEDNDDYNGGHSVVVVSVGTSGINVLDCNWSNAPQCKVQKHTVLYNDYYTFFTISRVTTSSSGSSGSVISGPNPDDYTVPTRNIAYNGTFATGSDVMWVQAVLYQLGYSIDVDGKYGNDSKNLVMQFQSKYGLEVDGVVGANTVIKMQELWAAKKSELAEKKIVFNANGGTFKSGTTITKTATSGKFTVPDEIPTRDGFDFICWIDKVGGTYYYQGRGSYDIASNMELHALWMKSAYRINLDPNGGEFRYKTILTIPVSGKNRARGLAESIIYNSAYGETSSTNEYGAEYAVDEFGLVTDYASYGKNNMSIPTNGFVISLHAENSCFYMATELIKKGTSYAYYDSSANMIYIFDSNEIIFHTPVCKSLRMKQFSLQILSRKKQVIPSLVGHLQKMQKLWNINLSPSVLYRQAQQSMLFGMWRITEK